MWPAPIKTNPLRQSQWLAAVRCQCASCVISAGVSESRNTKLKLSSFRTFLDIRPHAKSRTTTRKSATRYGLSLLLHSIHPIFFEIPVCCTCIRFSIVPLDNASFFQKSHSDQYYRSQCAPSLHLLVFFHNHGLVLHFVYKTIVHAKVD